MNPWRPLPLLRLVFPFISGTIGGLVAGFCPLPPFVFIIILFTGIFFLIFSLKSIRYGLRWLPGIIIMISLIACGFGRAIEGRRTNEQKQVAAFAGPGTFLVKTTESPLVRNGSVRMMAEMLALKNARGWEYVGSKCILRIYGNSEPGFCRYGRFYLVRGRPDPLVFFSNPHTFNYSAYLASMGVKYLMSCTGNECRQVMNRKSPGMFAFALDIRDRLLKVLKDNGLSGQEFSVSAALLLGYVNDIDPGLKSAFAASGTMHILSVSGMHVGIIFIFLDTVLSFLDKLRYGRSMKCLTEIVFIWSYAAITGFSPAVLRAAASLSLLIAGKSIRRQPEMMNVLSASVFILLISEPGLLTDVGFQLSYLAVIGIVLLYKPIYSLYQTRLWFPEKVWGLIAVSIAAQLSTFPLSLFYFHRFPNYFILSNLIIVPLSNGIIFMGIISLLLSPLPFAGKLSVAGLKFLVHLLNACVLWIEHLPGSVSRGFFPCLPAVLAIYMLIVSICLFLMKTKQVFLLVAIACIVILEASVVYDHYKGAKGYHIAVHKGCRGYAIRILKGRKELCFNSGLEMMNDNYTGEQIMNERMAQKTGQVFIRWMGISGWQKVTGFGEVGRFGHMLVAKGRMIWLLDHDLSPGLRSGIHADIVLITADIHVDMKSLSRVFTAGLVLNVSNASHRKVLKWADEAKRIGLDFYDLRTAGFYHEEI